MDGHIHVIHTLRPTPEVVPAVSLEAGLHTPLVLDQFLEPTDPGGGAFIEERIPGGTDTGHTPYFEITAQVETATTYAEQIIKTEGYRMESRFADGVKGLHVYGAKVTDGNQIAKIIASVA